MLENKIQLSASDMERFEQTKSMHPSWSEEQVWTKVSFDKQGDELIATHPEGLDITDDVIRIILRRAEEWLRQGLPVIYDRLKDFFVSLWDNISTWIQEGLNKIIELIGDVLSGN